MFDFYKPVFPTPTEGNLNNNQNLNSTSILIYSTPISRQNPKCLYCALKTYINRKKNVFPHFYCRLPLTMQSTTVSI